MEKDNIQKNGGSKWPKNRHLDPILFHELYGAKKVEAF
jgi:hypothetical protein